VSADTRRRAGGRKRSRPAPARWRLRLYIAGWTPNATAAYDNLKRLCEAHLPGRHAIEVIDIEQDPVVARRDQILAIPTVVRCHPAPVRRVIGTLSDGDRVAAALELG